LVACWAGYLAWSFSVPTSRVRVLMFVAGMLIVEILHLRPAAPSKAFGAAAAVACVLALVFAYVIDVHRPWVAFLPELSAGQTMLPGIPNYHGPYKVIAHSLALGAFCYYCIASPRPFAGVFAGNLLRGYGSMSYSYYLIHGFALKALSVCVLVVYPLNGPNVALFVLLLPVAFAATLAASILLYVAIEKPFSLTPPRKFVAAPAQLPAAAGQVN
jgi:peptidoglycan/LPS O-acetylase OafA/YrhL